MISKDKKDELKVENSIEKAIAADFEEAGVRIDQNESMQEKDYISGAKRLLKSKTAKKTQVKSKGAISIKRSAQIN